MRKSRFFTIGLSLAAAIAALFLFSCSRPKPPAAVPQDAVSAATVEANGPTASQWAKRFPLEVKMNESNKLMAPSPTGYGGSVQFQRVELLPEISTNFKGSPFLKDYAEDRGHVYALEDLLASKRIGEKTPGACLSCKTSDIADIFASQGWEYAKKPLAELAKDSHPGIDCLTCHDPSNGYLRVVQPGFIEAAAKTGIDLSKATRSQMETYVCAQCHSEYYFEPVSTKVVFPWANGLGASAVWTYYEGKPSGFDGDFTHTDSGARLLKAQHPDFEEYSAGVHGQSQVSCSTCHMPKSVIEGTKVRSHHITSPLKNIESSCIQCHRNKTPEWLLAQTKTRQDTVFAAQKRAGNAVAEAHDAIAMAVKRAPASSELVKARELVRKAQWFWDYTASANSMGFHNPVGALENLSIALEAGKDAAALAKTIR